jgi:hypothetical protein
LQRSARTVTFIGFGVPVDEHSAVPVNLRVALASHPSAQRTTSSIAKTELFDAMYTARAELWLVAMSVGFVRNVIGLHIIECYR